MFACMPLSVFERFRICNMSAWFKAPCANISSQLHVGLAICNLGTLEICAVGSVVLITRFKPQGVECATPACVNLNARCRSLCDVGVVKFGSHGAMCFVDGSFSDRRLFGPIRLALQLLVLCGNRQIAFQFATYAS